MSKAKKLWFLIFQMDDDVGAYGIQIESEREEKHTTIWLGECRLAVGVFIKFKAFNPIRCEQKFACYFW